MWNKFWGSVESPSLVEKRRGKADRERDEMMAASEQEMHPGIEIDNNHIFFYTDVTEEKILMLRKSLSSAQKISKHMTEEFCLESPIPIHLHICSYGGSLLPALGMYDLLAKSPVPVYTHVEGLAMSAGTILSIAGKKRLMTSNSTFLIHELKSGFWGKFSDFQDEMKNLETLMEKVKAIYLRHGKIPENVLEDLLKKDLYLTAEQCLEYGLIDEIV